MDDETERDPFISTGELHEKWVLFQNKNDNKIILIF